MKQSFRVELQKEYLTFSAAHFITFAGSICERLHGHNYRVRCVIEGPLDENQYVIDFIALRDSLKKIVDELEHRMLLPTSHPLIRVQPATSAETGEEIVVTFEDRRWVFPAGDCILLPVENTTAELVARYIGERLLDAMDLKTGGYSALEIGVDENQGQWGICRFDLTQ